MVALVALSAIHIFMVFAGDPYAIRAITTGGYNPEKSPEARNARPFYNLFGRRKSKELVSAREIARPSEPASAVSDGVKQPASAVSDGVKE